MNMAAQTLIWQVGQISLTLDQPRLIGILNITPDSFSDGGAYPTAQHAMDAALRMRDEGACMIDVGGESTRPGSTPVDSDEQVRRVVPVIEGVRKLAPRKELLISVDTTRSEVAQAALDAGADVINDISAGRDDVHMLPLAASHRCGIILMHRLHAPQRDSYSDQYATPPDYNGDVVGFVRDFLAQRAETAVSAGVTPSSIVVDPGLGFGKSVAQNYELAGRIHELAELGYPVLSASSRKSFIGAASGVSLPQQRLAGTLAVSIALFFAGVRLFRVHDVAAHREALAVAQKILGAAVVTNVAGVLK